MLRMLTLPRLVALIVACLARRASCRGVARGHLANTRYGG